MSNPFLPVDVSEAAMSEMKEHGKEAFPNDLLPLSVRHGLVKFDHSRLPVVIHYDNRFDHGGCTSLCPISKFNKKFNMLCSFKFEYSFTRELKP